jgi:hypothetical protein
LRSRTVSWAKGDGSSRTNPDAIRRVWLGLHPYRDHSPALPASVPE